MKTTIQKRFELQYQLYLFQENPFSLELENIQAGLISNSKPETSQNVESPKSNKPCNFIEELSCYEEKVK
jgi:hypothetical protein